MNPSPDRRRRSRSPRGRSVRRAAVWVGALAVAAPALGAPPVDPHVVTSLPQTDGVSLEGYAVGVPVTLQVVRGSTVIAESLPVTPVTDGNTTLAEVNVVGAVTGGCWQGHTPDITYGDVIRVTQGAVVENATVQNVTAGQPTGTDPEITVDGSAFSPTGAALPATGIQQILLSQGFSGGRPFRRTPEEGTVAPITLMPGHWRATFSLTGADHLAALGATSVASWSTDAGTEATEVEYNPAIQGGPEAPCTAPAVTEGVTRVTPPAFLYNSESLTVTGVATGNATSVTLTISDTNAFTQDVTAGPVAVATFGGGKVWSAGVPGDAIRTLTDGQLIITPTINPGLPTARAGSSTTITKNMVIPDTTAPTVSIATGPKPFERSRAATFTFTSSEAGTFQCRLDAAAFAACASPHLLVGLTDGPHTVTIRATDAAGNVSPLVSSTWQVDTAKPRVRSTVSLPLRRFFARTGRLAVDTTCNERCTATVVTRVIMPGVSPGQVRAVRTRTVNAGRTGRTRTALTAGQLTALRRSLGAGQVVQLAITTTAVDQAGNRTVSRARVNMTAALLR